MSDNDSSLNPRIGGYQRRKKPTLSEIINGIKRGNRVLLSQAITILESTRPEDKDQGHALIEACLPLSGKSLRIGVSGTPGVGKSTFIDSFGMYLLGQGKKLAVLAIDPTSARTRGSILGDKTRMNQLSQAKEAFIRPSATGLSLGGVARRTRESIIVCEAAGFDVVIVETVGVGQSEIAVHSMTDLFLLLLLPGAGDELQGIKRGIMEIADVLAINKADGSRLELAKKAQQNYRNALKLFPHSTNGWQPRVLACSAIEKSGIDTIWAEILKFEHQMKTGPFFIERRQEQAKYWLKESIEQQLIHYFMKNPEIKSLYEGIENQVFKGEVSPFKAADMLLERFMKV